MLRKYEDEVLYNNVERTIIRLSTVTEKRIDVGVLFHSLCYFLRGDSYNNDNNYNNNNNNNVNINNDNNNNNNNNNSSNNNNDNN